MPLKPYLAIIDEMEKLKTNDLKNRKKIIKGIPIIEIPNNQISDIDKRLEVILLIKVFTIFKLFSFIFTKKVLISFINIVLSFLLIKKRKILPDKIPTSIIIIKNKYFFF